MAKYAANARDKSTVFNLMLYVRQLVLILQV
jgi:hypothetical protein